MVANKGQVATLDLVLSAFIFLFFVALAAFVFTWDLDEKDAGYVYGSTVYRNIERLEGSFLMDYRIDDAKLQIWRSRAPFASEVAEKIVADTNLPADNVCIYFEDDLSSPVLGDCPGAPACDRATRIFAKPVLYKKKITNMLVVVCI